MRDYLRGHAPTLAGAACLCAALPLFDLGEHVKWIEIAFVVVFLVLSLCIHEVAHAWVADRCGDPTARDLGRITLNPLPHIDPFMTVIFPVVILVASQGSYVFGGAKPVPVNYTRLRHPLRDMSLVALAGPASNALLAVVFALAWKAAIYVGDYETRELLPRVLRLSMQSNLLLAVFNMLPIPPLDGSRVMTWLLPAPLRPPYIALERFGLILVMALVFLVPATSVWINSGVRWMSGVVDWATGGVW